jgi:hypothetical protein
MNFGGYALTVNQDLLPQRPSHEASHLPTQCVIMFLGVLMPMTKACVVSLYRAKVEENLDCFELPER